LSFGEQVRHDLVERAPAKPCCRTAVLSGLVRTAGVLQVRARGELAVRLDNLDVAAARLVFGLVRGVGADSEILSYREPRFSRRSVVSLRLSGERSLQLLHELGVLSAELLPLERPPRRVVARACCRGAYLRGVFVGAGSVSGPRAAGHLELRAQNRAAAEGLAELAAEDGLQLSVSERRGHAIAYAKRKPAIRDVLVYMGAHDAALSFEEAEVMAATRERANRLTNCDEANLARQGSAARRQRRAIQRLALEGLEPDLREVAELRLRHPDLSLAELGRRARPELPKSTVANRMRRLLALTT
jgi:cell division protein WhiA